MVVMVQFVKIVIGDKNDDRFKVVKESGTNEQSNHNA